MLLSIIIVSYNTRELLEKCLDSAVRSLTPDAGNVKTTGQPHASSVTPHASSASYEIIVVDNNSTDGTKKYLSNIALERYGNIDKKRKQSKRLNVYKANANERSIPLKVIFNNDNTGFAKANNQGIKIAEGKYILLLNSDTIVKDGALEILVDYLENHPDTAAVSPLLLNPDNTPQLEYFMRFPNLWQIFFYHNRILRPFCKFIPGLKNKIYIFPQEKPFESEQLPGAALMARRETFQKVGLLDEDYPFFYEDVDWCYRAKVLKQKLVIVPTAKVVHLKGGSWKKEKKRPADFYQGVFNSLLLFVKKNYGEKEEKKFRRAIKINEFFKFRNFR